MIRLSPDAEKTIRHIRVQRKAPEGVGLKLIKGTRGELALMLAAPRPGDIVLPNEEDPLLSVDGEIAFERRGWTLDVKEPIGSDARPTFVLLDPLADV